MTPSSTDDDKQLPALIEQSFANGMDVKEIIADKVYAGKDNLAKMNTEAITSVVPLHPVVHEGGEHKEDFDRIFASSPSISRSKLSLSSVIHSRN